MHTGKVDIGQRISTALALIVSEELDVAYDRVDVKRTETDVDPNEGFTAGSMSMQHSGRALRIASANARRYMLSIASKNLGVDLSTLEVEDGLILSRETNNTITYWEIMDGKKFDSLLGKTYENLFDECKNTKNVNYFGFLKNEKVIEKLKKMHIFAYPSIWPETSCIAAIESMAAGCEVVTTDLGALNETCSPFGKIIYFEKTPEELEVKYKEALLESINNFWSDTTQKKLKLQREKINKTYSWDVRSVEWKNFLSEAKK